VLAAHVLEHNYKRNSLARDSHSPLSTPFSKVNTATTTGPATHSCCCCAFYELHPHPAHNHAMWHSQIYMAGSKTRFHAQAEACLAHAHRWHQAARVLWPSTYLDVLAQVANG
jgi:hypothetical protein